MAYIFKYPKKKRNYDNNNEKRKLRQKIYNSTKWKALKTAKLQESPLCQMCLKKGVITPAAHCHHIISFMKAKNELEMQALAFDYNNIMTLCAQCHQKIHNGKNEKSHDKFYLSCDFI